MTKVGIKKIGFIEQNEVNDQWVQQEQEQPAQRSITDVYLNGSHWFKSVDQQSAILTEKSSVGEEGKVFEQEVQFTVRREDDMTLGKKYLNRPLVLHVKTIDGKEHVIGTKSYPAYIESDKRYDGVTTNELSLTVKYKSTTSLLK